MYKECRKDARIVNAAKDAYNALDSLNLHHVLVEWYEVVRLAIGAYASDHGLGLDWIEGHPLHIVMLHKISELMGFEFRENANAGIDNAYDWTASLVRCGLVHRDKDCPLVARRITCDECGYPLKYDPSFFAYAVRGDDGKRYLLMDNLHTTIDPGDGGFAWKEIEKLYNDGV